MKKVIIAVVLIAISIASCTGRYAYRTGVTNGCMGKRSGLIGYN